MSALSLHAPCDVRRSKKLAERYISTHVSLWNAATLGAVLLVAVTKSLATLSTELVRGDV